MTGKKNIQAYYETKMEYSRNTNSQQRKQYDQ